jgi:hypothetical protein
VSPPPIPAPLEPIGSEFSFYPPIANIPHNRWVYRRSTWSEILVVNAVTSEELWLPRRFLGGVSGEPVVVGLLKELEYRAGVVYPRVRRVIEMPRPSRTPEKPHEKPAVVVGIRVESRRDSRTGRIILGTIAAGLLAWVSFLVAIRDGGVGSTLAWTAAPQIGLPFTANDDYATVTARLGPPADDRWRTARDGVRYRRLWYPQRSFAVIFSATGRYAGAVDSLGRVVHSVEPLGARR